MILLGAPGAGKGTQAELLVEKLSIPAISTGNMLREAMSNGSALGAQVKQFMEAGELVPDKLILGIASKYIVNAKCLIYEIVRKTLRRHRNGGNGANKR